MLRIKIEPNKQYSAFALITMEEGEERKYLLQWNARWGVFNLIGGKLDNERGDNNSLARTIYREIEEDYGTNEDFQALMAAAHERGMVVVVDLVLNHSS